MTVISRTFKIEKNKIIAINLTSQATNSGSLIMTLLNVKIYSVLGTLFTLHSR